MDYSVLKKNIKIHCVHNDMNQTQFAEAIGMSQSNVSKIMNTNDDSRCFTVDQLCQIADLFSTSVDELLGRPSTPRNLEPESICQFIVELMEADMLRPSDIQVTEDAYILDQDGIRGGKQDAKYNCLYFPNFWEPDPKLDDMEFQRQVSEMTQVGNDLPKAMAINEFLSKYIEAFLKHEKGEYTDEVYGILKDAYFKVLKAGN